MYMLLNSQSRLEPEGCEKKKHGKSRQLVEMRKEFPAWPGTLFSERK